MASVRVFSVASPIDGAKQLWSSGLQGCQRSEGGTLLHATPFLYRLFQNTENGETRLKNSSTAEGTWGMCPTKGVKTKWWSVRPLHLHVYVQKYPTPTTTRTKCTPDIARPSSPSKQVPQAPPCPPLPFKALTSLSSPKLP